MSLVFDKNIPATELILRIILERDIKVVSVRETGEAFNDGSHIIYVNGKYKGDDDIGKLMKDFHCKSADKMQFEALADSVRHFKETEEGRMKSGGLQLCEDRSETENVRVCVRQLKNMGIKEQKERKKILK